MLWNSHFLNTKFSKLFMYIPRFQFGLGNLVSSPGKVMEKSWKSIGQNV